MALTELRRIGCILFMILMLIFSGCFFQTSRALSEWRCESYEDFRNGTWDNITITNNGSNTRIRLADVPMDWSEIKQTSKPTRSAQNDIVNIWNTDKFLLFGGSVSTGAYQDTWIYDHSDNKWTEVKPKNEPAGRSGHSMAAVHGTDKVILFGGFSTGWGDDLHEDTWVYDLSDNNWTEVITTDIPTAKYEPGLESNWGTDQVVLYGGVGPDAKGTDDIWLFDHSDNNWTEMTPATGPIERFYPSFTSVYNDDKFILFGGYNDYSIWLNDTWVYDLSENNWTKRSPSSYPKARSGQGASTIIGTDKILLFGGTELWSYHFDDTWIYDLGDDSWERQITENKPTARDFPGMDHLWDTDKVLLFGGRGTTPPIGNDLWIFDWTINEYFYNGTYYSIIYDTSTSSDFKTLSWNADVLVNTSIKFQLRTSETNEKIDTINFVGPDGNRSTYYTQPAQKIWDGHFGDRWVQYKIEFRTTNITETAFLNNVSLIYNNLPITEILAPDDEMIISDNRPVLKWNFTDYDSSSQSAFQVLIDNESNFDEIDFDSGEQTSSFQYWQFPNGTAYSNLPEGIWYWKIRTKDSDGDWGYYTGPGNFLIDTRLPGSSITAPYNGGHYDQLPEISGNAEDPTPGSGLDRVELSLTRLGDNYTWTGNKWENAKRWFYAAGTTSWSYDPGDIEWDSNLMYTLKSRGVDNASNIEIPKAGISFMIDFDRPISSIDHPASGSFQSEVLSITGTASDQTGSGVEIVELTIYRSEDKRYWTGTGWDTDKHWLTAEGGDNWSFDTSTIPWTTDKNYRIESRATDLIGNVEQVPSSSTFMYDDKPPDLSFRIKDKTTYITKPDVILLISASDTGSGIDGMSLSSNGHDWLEWEVVVAELEYVFKGGDGLKNIYIKVRDRAGNIAGPLSESVTLDATPPVALSIIINKNANMTNILTVDLDLYAEDALSGIDMMSIGYDERSWSDWEPYLTQKEFPLENENGIRTLLFKVSDKAGNVGQTSDNIILDTEPPHSQLIIINRNEEVTDSGEVTLTIKAEDMLTGVELMSFSHDGINWTDWEDYEELLSKPYTLTAGNGIKTVYFRSKDRAGNTAESVFDSIVLIIEVSEKEEEGPLVITGAESNILIFILIIIAVIISVPLVSMFAYRKRKKRIKEEREAVIRSNLPSLVSKPKADALPAGPTIPQLPVASPVVSEPEKLQLQPAQIGIPTPTEPAPAVPIPALPTSTIPAPTVPTPAVPAPTGTVDATEQTPEQPAPEWSALFDSESPDSEKKEDFPCSTCGEQLTKISDEGKFYCYTCQKYE